MIGLGIVAAPAAAALVICAVLLVAAQPAIVRRPDRLVVVGVLAAAVVPLSGLPVYGAVHPSVALFAVAALLALSGVWRTPKRSINTIDVGAAVLFGGLIISCVAGHQSAKNLGVASLLWFLPYVAGRGITRVGLHRHLLRALAAAGCLALIFGAIEVVGPNLLLDIFPWGRSSVAGLSADVFVRLGHTRTQGAQGHPILYAMFLCTAAVAAGSLWLGRSKGHRFDRWLLLPAAGLVALQASSLSRTGFLMLAVAAGVILACSGRVVLRRKNAKVLVALALLIPSVLAVPQTRDLVFGSGGTASEQASIEASAEYRSELRRLAFSSGFIDPLGTQRPLVGPDGSESIDNGYLLLSWQWGYLPAVGFAVWFLGLFLAAARHRADITKAAIPAIGLALMVAIASVALFGQIQSILFLMIGAAAGLDGVGASRKIARRSSSDLAEFQLSCEASADLGAVGSRIALDRERMAVSV